MGCFYRIMSDKYLAYGNGFYTINKRKSLTMHKKHIRK